MEKVKPREITLFKDKYLTLESGLGPSLILTFTSELHARFIINAAYKGLRKMLIQVLSDKGRHEIISTI